jgi:tripartite-type tricarboxylate transporter receptor subunit TctC
MNSKRFGELCIIFGATAALLGQAGMAAAASQDYPTKPVRVIVAFAAGGFADFMGRQISLRVSDRLGQTFVIDNRGGAGGNIAAELTAKSAPDGYTIMMATIGTHAINHSLYSRLSFHPVRDFTPVALVGESPNALVTSPKVQAGSIQELIALAKSKPGQLNYGSSGAGTTVHLSGELFKTMTGIRVVHVPYKGATEALTGLLAGQTDYMFASLSSSLPLIKAGKLKAFGVTGAQRSPSIPELPTVAEAGNLPGFAAAAWFAVVAPAGLAKPVVGTLSKATLTTLETPEVKGRLFASGVEVRTSGPEELARFIVEEMKKWEKVVKESGAKVD